MILSGFCGSSEKGKRKRDIGKNKQDIGKRKRDSKSINEKEQR